MILSGCLGRLVSPSTVAITNDETQEMNLKVRWKNKYLEYQKNDVNALRAIDGGL